MILLISPHTVIKRNYYINNLTQNEINKLEDKSLEIYSAGTNMALIHKILQTEPFMLTFFGGVNGKHLKNFLHVNKIKSDSVHVSKNSYEKINLIDRVSGTKTVIKDFYVSADEKTALAYLNIIKEHFKRCDIAILDDRISHYLPEDIVNQIYEEAKKSNVRIFKDMKSKLNFEKLNELKPYCIKLNKNSLTLNNINTSNIDDLKIVAKKIIDCGVKYVVFDNGINGVYLFTKKEFLIITNNLSLNVREEMSEPTDSLLAGITAGFSKGYEIEKTLRLAYSAELATYIQGSIHGMNRKSIFDIKNSTKISYNKLEETEE